MEITEFELDVTAEDIKAAQDRRENREKLGYDVCRNCAVSHAAQRILTEKGIPAEDISSAGGSVFINTKDYHPEDLQSHRQVERWQDRFDDKKEVAPFKVMMYLEGIRPEKKDE